MKSPLFITVVSLLACLSCSPTKTCNERPLSLQIAYSEMQRVPRTTALDFRTSARWNYCAGLELYAFQKVAQRYSDSTLANYVYTYVDTMVQADGSIYSYKVDEYNLDNVNSGKLLFDVYDATHEERFRKAADLLSSQLLTHPRTEEGGFWHKKVYPHQMWLDGLYMGAPFYAQYGARFGVDVAEDMVNQFLIVGRHTYDEESHLYRHAWDESRSMFWADSITGRSQHAWGRANGWYMMAMVDVLEFIPTETPGRKDLVERLQNLAEALLSVRDSATGMWFQVLDSPYREGNYVESTCSAMFIYSMLKGSRMGYFDAKFDAIGREAYQQFINRFVKYNEDGTISITDCCAVAGLGGKNMRDGSFDYYIHEPVRNNDPKAIGPFVLASLEIESDK